VKREKENWNKEQGERGDNEGGEGQKKSA